MDIYDSELHEKIIERMRAREIEDFSDEELERVFYDFDVPERTYLRAVAWMVDSGLTIEKVYQEPNRSIER